MRQEQTLLIQTIVSLGPGSLKGDKLQSRIKSLFRFCILHSYALLRVTFCVIITVSRGQDSIIFCNLELHVLRQENRA